MFDKIEKSNYYPKQIPYILNENFKRNIIYKEYKYNSLSEYCMCIWEMKSKEKISKPIINNILPDGCIDIIIDFVTKEIFVVGFSKETFALKLENEVDYLGVRFKPGAFYSLFSFPADSIMDTGISLEKLENKKILSNIFDVTDSDARINMFKDYLICKIKNAQDTRYIKFVDYLYNHPIDQSIHNIASYFGYSEKQTNRIFKQHYGVSPKTLLNILRLHLCLTLLIDEKTDLKSIAALCGFYDQSHFIKEIKRFTGISPLNILEN